MKSRKKSRQTKGKQQTEDSEARARRQASYIRLLEFLVAALALSIGVYEGVFASFTMLWVAALLLYSIMAQGIAYQMERKGKRQEEASRILVQADAGLIGISIAALHYAPVPSLALMVMLHANAVTSGGLKPWLMNILVTVIGAALGALVFGTEFLHPNDTSLILTVLPFLGLALYIGVTSLYAHEQTVSAHSAQQEIVDQQMQAIELSKKLAKYLPPQIWGSLFSGKRDAKLETRRKRLTIFFSDIKGFSNISEELPLNTLTKMLNSYLEEMTRIALRYGGTIDKFIGDAIMIFFGDPVSKGSKEDAYNCVAMALEMQRHMKLLRQRWEREGITQKLEIRIGINSGYATVGNFGTESRMDYTILGTDVNLASRLETTARPNRILISRATWELVKNRIMCRDLGAVEVKGFNRPIPVYEVQELKGKANTAEKFLSVRTDGFSIHLEIERIKNFDERKILVSLARTASALARKRPVSMTFEADGFSLYADSDKIKPRDKQKIIEVMGKAANKIKNRRNP